MHKVQPKFILDVEQIKATLIMYYRPFD
jgi:hypothetical protein